MKGLHIGVLAVVCLVSVLGCDTEPKKPTHVASEKEIINRAFLDDTSLNIFVEEISTDWESVGDGRDEKTLRYKVILTNKSEMDFSNVIVEYCQYRDRDDYIEVDNYNMFVSVVQAGRVLENTTRGGQRSYRNLSNGFLNNVVGARFRFTLLLEDGSETVREICVPNELPLETFPWKKGARIKNMERANALCPADYPPKNLDEKMLRDLTNQFISTYEKNDSAAWEALLFPMHPGQSNLDDNQFKYYEFNVSNMEIMKVNGRNVKVSMRHRRSRDQDGWIQITESGHIKYTPLEFRHPIKKACAMVPLLAGEHYSWRLTAAHRLKRDGIPTFDYDPNADKKEQIQKTELILEWLENNGATYDTTEPKLPIPKEQFEECLKQAKELADRNFQTNWE